MTVKDELLARVEAMDDDQAAHALRLLAEEPLSAEDDAAIAEGLADLRAGRVLSADEVRALFA